MVMYIENVSYVTSKYNNLETDKINNAFKRL